MPNNNSKEYFVSKLSFREDEKRIEDICVYEYDGHTLSGDQSRDRNWLVQKKEAGSKISIINRNIKGKWVRGKEFTYQNDLFTWGQGLPKNITKRKTFVSYYHNDDQEYRENFENLFEDLIVSKSVEDGDIDSDNSDEYIKQLIQKDFLTDTTVLAVLVGPKTKCRKHVDWEIAGAISTRIGGNSGLIGILLPTHPDYGSDKYHANNLPDRLAANVKSGYAKLYDWTEDRVQMQKYLEAAFANKSDTGKIVNKAIPQMTEDTCE